MKNRWLPLLLAASLAGNLVELGVFTYRELKRRHDMQDFFSRLEDGTSRVDVNVLDGWRASEFESLNVADLRLERELQLARADRADSSGLQPIVARMAQVSREQYRLAYESRRRLFSLTDSVRRRSLEQRWRRMTGLRAVEVRSSLRPTQFLKPEGRSPDIPDSDFWNLASDFARS